MMRTPECFTLTLPRSMPVRHLVSPIRKSRARTDRVCEVQEQVCENWTLTRFPCSPELFPCSRFQNSLFACAGNCPVRHSTCCRSRRGSGTRRAKKAKFPVNFPVRRELAWGDWFAADCLHHHAVLNSTSSWRLAKRPRIWRPFLRSPSWPSRSLVVKVPDFRVSLRSTNSRSWQAENVPVVLYALGGECPDTGFGLAAIPQARSPCTAGGCEGVRRRRLSTVSAARAARIAGSTQQARPAGWRRRCRGAGAPPLQP
jgi:hypothetical protein